jgi:hypothetical protein
MCSALKLCGSCLEIVRQLQREGPEQFLVIRTPPLLLHAETIPLVLSLPVLPPATLID